MDWETSGYPILPCTDHRRHYPADELDIDTVRIGDIIERKERSSRGNIFERSALVLALLPHKFIRIKYIVGGQEEEIQVRPYPFVDHHTSIQLTVCRTTGGEHFLLVYLAQREF